MSTAKIDDRAIDQLFAEYKADYLGLRNDYFAPLFLVREHDIDLDQALLQTTFGGADYGFDAFHFNKKTCNLYLYQFKWTPFHLIYTFHNRYIYKRIIVRAFGDFPYYRGKSPGGGIYCSQN